MKYISRAGKKNPDKYDEDLDKAVWYLKRMTESYTRVSDPIDTKDYIQDKGLDGTARGLALELIDRREFDLAIQVLTSFRDRESA